MTSPDAAALLSLLKSPLVVVTAASENQRGGLIAVSVFAASIVPEHPRILLELQKRNHTHTLLTAAGRCAVHLIPQEHWRWLRRFGFSSQTKADKFRGLPWHEGPHRLPLLDDALAVLLCRTVNAMDGGDMTIFLADVEEARRLRPGDPLRWDQAKRLLPPAWRAEYARKLAHDIPDSAARMRRIDHAPFQPPRTAPR